ncbi:MAG: hypothetical protein ABEJ55_07745, partial [Halanaeroarchaeum sp.]
RGQVAAMTTATTDQKTDLDTGFGVLFGLLATGAAATSLFADGLTSALGFGAAVLFGALLVVSVHIYQ